MTDMNLNKLMKQAQKMQEQMAKTQAELEDKTVEVQAAGGKVTVVANGSGDVTAALFTAHYVETADPAVSLERTASSVFDLIETTYRSGERELQLVQAQKFYAEPRMQFKARQVR